jgi:hypothetical protein
MKVGVLTAALQELTPREVRDADRDRAIEDWIQFAGELAVDTIQLSAALHPSETEQVSRRKGLAGRRTVPDATRLSLEAVRPAFRTARRVP